MASPQTANGPVDSVGARATSHDSAAGTGEDYQTVSPCAPRASATVAVGPGTTATAGVLPCEGLDDASEGAATWHRRRTRFVRRHARRATTSSTAGAGTTPTPRSPTRSTTPPPRSARTWTPWAFPTNVPPPPASSPRCAGARRTPTLRTALRAAASCCAPTSTRFPSPRRPASRSARSTRAACTPAATTATSPCCLAPRACSRASPTSCAARCVSCSSRPRRAATAPRR